MNFQGGFPHAINIKITFDDGTINELNGEEAHRWTENMGKIMRDHNQLNNFTSFEWKRSKIEVPLHHSSKIKVSENNEKDVLYENTDSIFSINGLIKWIINRKWI